MSCRVLPFLQLCVSASVLIWQQHSTLVSALAEAVPATTTRYVSYNSSDLSYLSNGIQFPVAVSLDTVFEGGSDSVANTNDTTTRIQWLRTLFDHMQWRDALEKLPQGSACLQDVTAYLEALRNETIWALRMYDASGRYENMFFFGNDFWVGSRSECEELGNPMVHSTIPPFGVQFFVAKLRININEEMTPVTRQLILGQCLPSSCQSMDITKLIAHNKPLARSLQVVEIRRVPGEYRLIDDVKFQIIGGVTLVVAVLAIVATVFEAIAANSRLRRVKVDEETQQQQQQRRTSNNNNINNNNVDGNTKSQDALHKKDVAKSNHKPGILLQLLTSFSVLSNGRKILSLDKLPRDSIQCIHGMRFFSILWIIMVHTYLEVFSISDNKIYRTVTERGFLYQTVSNATFSVDTFFFISGLLVTITYFRSVSARKSKSRSTSSVSTADINQGSNPNPDDTPNAMEAATSPSTSLAITLRSSTLRFLLLVFYRFVRLTPAYLFVLGVNELLLRYMQSNSIYSPAIIDHITCDAFWWRNALYINNFYPQHEFCMLWSWYMANDTQFYVLAVILLLIAVRSDRNCKIAAVAILVFLVTSWITTFVIAMQYNFVARVEEPFALFDQLYDKPWMRVGPYFIGMYTGYFMFKQTEPMKLRAPTVAAGWVLSISCLMSLVYGLGREGLVTPISAIYASLGHTAWGISLAWITVACCWGYGGPANAVLTFRAFLPLSRLAYCAYLIHPVLMVFTSFLMDGPIHLQQLNVMVLFLGNAVLSFIVALAISLGFEAPIVRLLKVSMSSSSKDD